MIQNLLSTSHVFRGSLMGATHRQGVISLPVKFWLNKGGGVLEYVQFNDQKTSWEIRAIIFKIYRFAFAMKCVMINWELDSVHT